MGRNDYGYDEEFDYVGSGMVAPDPRLFKVMPGTTGRRYVGKPVGECRLGDAASGVLGSLARRAGASAGVLRALKVWRKMGDRRVREHVRSIYLRQGRVLRELVVYVDTPGWAQEFQMFSGPYRLEWNHLCEVEGLPMQADRLTFRVSSRTGAAADPSASGPAEQARRCVRQVSPTPLSPEELARVEASVACIRDDALRRKAYSAMKSVMEWRKGSETK